MVIICENNHWVKSVRIWNYSVPYFPSFRLNTERYSVFLRIQFECRKIRTRITPNTDTFNAVDYSRWLFSQKPFIIDVWHRSEYALDFEYTSVLNILGFWIYQGCEYTRVLKVLLVLNMPGFWIYHCSKYTRVTQGSEYTWIFLNISWIYLIVPKFVWMAVVLHLLIVIPYLKKP